MDRPSKAPRVVRAAQAIGLSVPLSVINKLRSVWDDDCSGDEGSNSDLFSRMGGKPQSYVSSITTPYGKLFMSLDLGAEDGVFKWPLLNPIALLWYLCDRHSRFGSYLIEKLSGGIAEIAIWADEATSGNELRPDNHTKFFRMLWTITNLDEHFRSQDTGWFPIGIMRYDDLKRVRGHFSSVLGSVFRLFFKSTPLMASVCEFMVLTF